MQCMTTSEDFFELPRCSEMVLRRNQSVCFKKEKQRGQTYDFQCIAPAASRTSRKKQKMLRPLARPKQIGNSLPVPSGPDLPPKLERRLLLALLRRYCRREEGGKGSEEGGKVKVAQVVRFNDDSSCGRAYPYSLRGPA